jgi:hypothetical protein
VEESERSGRRRSRIGAVCVRTGACGRFLCSKSRRSLLQGKREVDENCTSWDSLHKRVRVSLKAEASSAGVMWGGMFGTA